MCAKKFSSAIFDNSSQFSKKKHEGKFSDVTNYHIVSIYLQGYINHCKFVGQYR